MSIRNFSAVGKTGFKFEDKDFADAAAIATTKLGTRTLSVPLVPYPWFLSGTSVAASTDGIFRPVTLPDANNGSIYFSLSLPANYDSGQPTIDVYWYSAAISGVVHFSLDIGFKIAGEATTLDGTFAADGTVGTTASQINKTTITVTGLTIAAGDIVGITLTRQPADAADTLGANIKVIGVVFNYVGRG